MKKVLSVLFLLLFLVGRGNKNYIKQVELDGSPLQYNYEIHNDFDKLIIKVYTVKNEKWVYVEEHSYYKNDLKDMLGISFENNEEIDIYLGDYIRDQASVCTYQTQMGNYNKGTVASRDRINIKNGKEAPFLAYWAYTENSQYEVTTHSDILGEDFLKQKVESDSGFLITLTFQ